ncbi:MAG: sigma-70 family RNA polymerase sigma factor [Myxococcales bacterium]|nr:sigma-70 family RNA polymerase sigma factor [Myxococcales bacterium]MCB9547046.1 sigma-70 family RNA polymerase sigma factor [Myxococcales bacterium]
MPTPPDEVLSPAGVERALSGDRVAAHALMAALMPAIQRRVNAALLRRAGARQGRPLRQELLDLTQEVFVALFENDGRALRRWDPAGGASLTTWVSRVADHQVASILRSGKRSPFTETPVESTTLELTSEPSASVHGRVSGRQQLGRLLDQLRAAISPLGYELFVDLFVDERDVDEICAARSMSPNAVYVWRNRLRRAAQEILQAEKDSDAPARMNG